MTYRLRESSFWGDTRSVEGSDTPFPSEWNTRYIGEGFDFFVANNQNRKNQDALIEEYSKDKAVIDLGAGSGYAGINAFKHGAKFVYFVEYDPQASLILARALEKLGFSQEQYQVINKDIEQLTVEDFAGPVPEVVYSEFYGPCIFDEGFVPYTKHLDTLFPDLYYAPECQAMEVCTWDTDYSVPPWPYKRPELIESFKVRYANSIWSSQEMPDYDPMPAPKPHTTHGMFYYNANTKELIDSVTVVTTTPGQMIGFFPIEYGCHHKYSFLEIPSIGWWVEEPGTYIVTMDVANSLTEMPRIIYPGEPSNGR